MAQYSRFDRAKILYNHLHFSEMPRETQREILRDDAYLEIVDHRNYNPRLIEYVVKLAPADESESLPTRFLRTLESPETLWRHAVENQLSHLERAALYVMCSMPSEVRLSDFSEMVTSYATHLNISVRGDDLRNALRVLEDTFVRIGAVESGPTVSFHNASIRDFLLSQIDADGQILEDLIDAATRFEQVELFYRYGTGFRWHYSETREFSGIAAWSVNNADHLVGRLTNLFDSSPATYVRVAGSPRGNRSARRQVA